MEQVSVQLRKLREEHLNKWPIDQIGQVEESDVAQGSCLRLLGLSCGSAASANSVPKHRFIFHIVRSSSTAQHGRNVTQSPFAHAVMIQADNFRSSSEGSINVSQCNADVVFPHSVTAVSVQRLMCPIISASKIHRRSLFVLLFSKEKQRMYISLSQFISNLYQGSSHIAQTRSNHIMTDN